MKYLFSLIFLLLSFQFVSAGELQNLQLQRVEVKSELEETSYFKWGKFQSEYVTQMTELQKLKVSNLKNENHRLRLLDMDIELTATHKAMLEQVALKNEKKAEKLQKAFDQDKKKRSDLKLILDERKVVNDDLIAKRTRLVKVLELKVDEYTKDMKANQAVVDDLVQKFKALEAKIKDLVESEKEAVGVIQKEVK